MPSHQSNLDLHQFRVLPKDHPLPPKAKSGVQFDTFSVNPEAYLPWLKSQLEGRGVSFVRRLVTGLDEAGQLAGEGGAVINATALGEPPEQNLGDDGVPMHVGPRCTFPSWCGGYEGVSDTRPGRACLCAECRRVCSPFARR
jgi:hypothetical protein